MARLGDECAHTCSRPSRSIVAYSHINLSEKVNALALQVVFACASASSGAQIVPVETAIIVAV